MLLAAVVIRATKLCNLHTQCCATSCKEMLPVLLGLNCASVSKRVLLQTLSHENEFDLYENELAWGKRFDMNGRAKIRFDTEEKSTFGMPH